MDKALYEEIINLARILEKINVKYMFVGGVAVAYYAKPRLSTNLPKGIDYDVDIWYLANSTNFNKLSLAIKTISPDLSTDLDKIIFDPKKTFLKFNLNNFHFDFLPELSPFDYKDFNKCFVDRSIAEIDNVKISIISKEHLILNKDVTGRSKDSADLKNLNKNSYKGFSR